MQPLVTRIDSFDMCKVLCQIDCFCPIFQLTWCPMLGSPKTQMCLTVTESIDQCVCAMLNDSNRLWTIVPKQGHMQM